MLQIYIRVIYDFFIERGKYTGKYEGRRTRGARTASVSVTKWMHYMQHCCEQRTQMNALQFLLKQLIYEQSAVCLNE